MAKEIGPTIPRWKLGEELLRMRTAAKITWEEVAETLGCSISKIKKIEGGYTGMNKSELAVVLDLYTATDSQRANLSELQKLGRKRGWWSQFGALPSQYTTFLGLESAATEMRIFEPLVVHGLFQTEEYARAVAETSTGRIDPAEAERQAAIRMMRQERVVRGEEPPEFWLVLDEAVLHRHQGGPKVMQNQLAYLLSIAKAAHLQIVPFEQGGHPGTLGGFILLEFDEDVHSPVMYVEGQAGGLYLEKAPDLRRGNLSFNQISATALSTKDSIALVERVADSLT